MRPALDKLTPVVDKCEAPPRAKSAETRERMPPRDVMSTRFLIEGRLRPSCGLTPQDYFALAVREWEMVLGWLSSGIALEPACILQQLVVLRISFESMRCLISRVIEMTLSDYRWDSNATGWARYGKNDE